MASRDWSGTELQGTVSRDTPLTGMRGGAPGPLAAQTGRFCRVPGTRRPAGPDAVSELRCGQASAQR